MKPRYYYQIEKDPIMNDYMVTLLSTKIKNQLRRREVMCSSFKPTEEEAIEQGELMKELWECWTERRESMYPTKIELEEFPEFSIKVNLISDVFIAEAIREVLLENDKKCYFHVCTVKGSDLLEVIDIMREYIQFYYNTFKKSNPEAFNIK